MHTYIEYELEDGNTIKIIVQDSEQVGINKASRNSAGDAIISAGNNFSAALDGVKSQAKLMKQKLEDLSTDEVEVKFGLTATLDAGNFAIGKIGAEAAYEITLKWKNKGAIEKK